MKFFAAMFAVLLVLSMSGCRLAGTPADLSPLATPEESDPESFSTLVDRYQKWTITAVSPQIEVAPEQQMLLLNFFNRCYAALAGLQKQDLSNLFDPTSQEAQVNMMINQLSLDFLVSSRRLSPVDLTLSDYHYNLCYESASRLDENTVEILLTESHRVSFSFLDGQHSYATGIFHRFVLTDSGGGWKIILHEKEEDVYLLIDQLVEAAWSGQEEELGTLFLSQMQQTAAATVARLQAQAKENAQARSLDRRRCVETGEPFLPITWDVDYNRAAALDYARRWVSKSEIIRNPSWRAYDEFGGNCNNYISQCIYAGGIPMDHTGPLALQWKWYGDHIGSQQTPYGRSPAWSGVNEFYDYCLHNQGSGMVAWAGGNPYCGELGDIIQLGAAGQWKHSVIISEVIYADDGYPAEYLIHSNTTDRLFYPVSAYPYSQLRLIRILGYNQT